MAAGDERIDGHPLALARTGGDGAAGHAERQVVAFNEHERMVTRNHYYVVPA